MLFIGIILVLAIGGLCLYTSIKDERQQKNNSENNENNEV